MRTFHLATIVALLVGPLLAACASSPSNYKGPLAVPDRFMVTYREEAPYTRDTVHVPIEQLRAVVPAVFQELGLPGAQASNAEVPVFITPHVRIRGVLFTGHRNSSFLDCGIGNGGLPRADTDAVTFMVMTRLRPSPAGRTIVETMLDGHSREHVSSNTESQCGGTGKLEKTILSMILEKALAGE